MRFPGERRREHRAAHGAGVALDQSTTARHGLIPADLDRRLHEQELAFPTLHLARMLARELDGRAPLLAAARVRDEVCDAWGRDSIERALVALDRAGYGRPFPKKPRRLRGHGARLEQRERIKGLVGKLPRAVALRLPTTSNNLLSGRRDGRDVWGEVRCNLTLRDGVHRAAGDRRRPVGQARQARRAARRPDRRRGGLPAARQAPRQQTQLGA